MYKYLVSIALILAIVGCTKTVVYSPNGDVYHIEDLFDDYNYEIYDGSGQLLTSFNSNFGAADITAQSGDIFYILPYEVEFSKPQPNPNFVMISYTINQDRYFNYRRRNYVYVLGTGYGHGVIPSNIPHNLSQYGLPRTILNVNDNEIPEHIAFIDFNRQTPSHYGPTLYILVIP